MINERQLGIIQFEKIMELVAQNCVTAGGRRICLDVSPSSSKQEVFPSLYRTAELQNLLSGHGYFPSPEHDDVTVLLKELSLEGALLDEHALLLVMRSAEVANTLIRFLNEKRESMPHLASLAAGQRPCPQVPESIRNVIDAEGTVKSSASPELNRIRRQIWEKRKESDRRFYSYLAQMRKLGYLRENEEGYFNGRRTLAVLAEHKGEVSGFVHDKSESGKTIFIEPGATIAINNEIAELEIDERREVSRLLRELCADLNPLVPDLVKGQDLLVKVDFYRAKALFAVSLNAVLPHVSDDFTLSVVKGYHPLLLLMNRKAAKPTVPLDLRLDKETRIMVISGPNAGGKTIALKTVALLQVMLQSGLLLPVHESSSFPFFEEVLVDIGDTQSIENELSTYSAKLKSMTSIIEKANEASLVLMDEFGSGTDPELGGAIAEAVLESLVASGSKGIITSHFGNIKVLAGKLEGVVNASMLFDAASFEPRYVLSVGEPGSSYTFEVAERIGFPKYLIERAKQKVDREKLNLASLLSEVQEQKARLQDEIRHAEREKSRGLRAREKYQALFDTWQSRMENEKEKRIELARLADYGRKYLNLMEAWRARQDRKEVIKRFIDGITAETKRQEALRKEQRHDSFADKKIARIKSSLRVGSRVKVLNSREVGIVEEIRDEKVQVKFGILKMTVGMENLILAEETQG